MATRCPALVCLDQMCYFIPSCCRVVALKYISDVLGVDCAVVFVAKDTRFVAVHPATEIDLNCISNRFRIACAMCSYLNSYHKDYIY